MKRHSISVVCIGALLFLYGTANATIWYVHPDSVINCIQDCLDSCSTGDTVLVGPGTYYENIIWPNMQGIDLMSENGADTTIIDGGGTGRVIQINTGVDSTTVIEGFIIQNGYHNLAGGGIYCQYSASPIIRGNIITNNEADSMGAGIQCSYGSSPLIDSNLIVNNTSHYVGAGIGCYENCHPAIQNNTIEDNNADFGSTGICLAFSSSPLITGNTITGNTGGFWFGGIGATSDCEPTIRNNTIENNEAMWGAGIGLEGYGVITGNTITGNVADSMGGGIVSYTNSSPLIDSNYISLNSAFKGGGIWIHESSHPTISNNTISANTASSGAGMRCSNYSHPNIFNNIIEDNYADSAGGGITCIYGSSPTITGNTISGNTVFSPAGGGIYCEENCSPNIVGNIIDNNAVYLGGGGGIFCYNNCSPEIRHNTITNNTATRAGGIELWISSSPTIKFNTITNNGSPGFGCGIDCYENSSPDIDSCTVAYNDGDGISCEGNSNPTINYVNIYGNTEYGVRNFSNITIDAENNWWGDPSGPGGVGPGTGDEVSNWVDYDPWLTDSVVWHQPGIEESEITTPLTLNLQVSPNPFTHRTNIRYTIQDAGYTIQDMTLGIYDAAGRLVKSFRITPYALRNTLSWDGRDDQNRMLSSGVYFVKLQVGNYIVMEKILLVK